MMLIRRGLVTVDQDLFLSIWALASSLERCAIFNK